MNIDNFDPIAWAAATPTTPLQEAQAVTDELIRRGINIAESYDDYLRLGFALAEGLGPDGHDLYHRLCAQSTKYSYDDCERKWKECLTKQDGRITIKTFYKMAQQGGVDLAAISRSGLPTLPHCHAFAVNSTPVADINNNNTQGFDYKQNNSSLNPAGQGTPAAPQGIGNMAKVANSSAEDYEREMDASCIDNPTFSGKLNIDDLPPLLRDAVRTQETPEGKDKIILGVLNLTSGFIPNVCGVYDRRMVYTPFYNMIVAPSGADKGVLPACVSIVTPVINHIKGQYEAARHDYLKQKAHYDALSKKEREHATEPEEPPYRSPLISVNASATSFYQDLEANGGWGAMFETEADTLTQSLKQDYGDYSSGLRKAFHHETIDYSRRKDNEHVYIASPRLSILLTCTPGQVPLLLSPQNTENGLANRFVFYLLRKSRGWRNVFEGGEETIAEKLSPLGARFKALYDELCTFNKQPLKFTLNEEQKVRFNEFFKPLYEEQIGLYGDSLDAFIFRLGLTTFRLAMVLTVLRHEEQQPFFSQEGEPLVCKDTDFQTAVTIAECLINHTVFVYKRLLPHVETPLNNSGKPMSAQELALLQALPQAFGRQDYIQQAKQMGISKRTADRYVGAFITDYNVVVRESTGHYRKV